MHYYTDSKHRRPKRINQKQPKCVIPETKQTKPLTRETKRTKCVIPETKRTKSLTRETKRPKCPIRETTQPIRTVITGRKSARTHWKALHDLHECLPFRDGDPGTDGNEKDWKVWKRWIAIDDCELHAAEIKAFGDRPTTRALRLLQRAFFDIMGPVADLHALWPNFWCSLVMGIRRPSVRTRVTDPNAVLSIIESSPQRTLATGLLRFFSRQRRESEAVAPQWFHETPFHCTTHRDADVHRLWTFLPEAHILLTVIITVDDRDQPWNGEWPLPYGDTKGVFVRLFPRSFLVDTPQKIERLLEFTVERFKSTGRAIEQFSLFFDDADEGDDIIVFGGI